MSYKSSRLRFLVRAGIIGLCTLFGSHLLIENYAQWQKISATVLYQVYSLQKMSTDYVYRSFCSVKTADECELAVRDYKKQIDILEAKIIELQATESYYQDIKELVDFKKRYHTSKKEIAQIILKHFSSDAHFYLLDAGKNKGITKDMTIAYKSCLVGKVTEVYKSHCKAILITDPLCKVAVKMVKTGIRGIHEGSYSLDTTHIFYVSHLSALEPEDTVITSGDGLVFPQGFLVGTIKKSTVKGLQYDVSIKPAVDFAALTYCTILEKGSELLSAE